MRLACGFLAILGLLYECHSVPSPALRGRASSLLTSLSAPLHELLSRRATTEDLDSGGITPTTMPTSPPSASLEPCVPKRGRTAITIGQDLDSINAYTAAFATAQPAPFAVMSYTSLRSRDEGESAESLTLTGLSRPIDYGSGVQWAQGLLEAYPHSALQLGLYLVDETEHIVAGTLDPLIHGLASFLNATQRAVYLRVGYEFDFERNHYPPREYVLAFQRIVRIFRKAHVHNVHFVWHASAESVPVDNEYADWYPGDEFVDWCGVSVFQQPFVCATPSLSSKAASKASNNASSSSSTASTAILSTEKCYTVALEKFAAFCKSREKPIMIAESTPFGGILDEKMLRRDPLAKNRAGYGGDSWNHWFEPVMNFIRTHDVRMWSYINCDWDSQPIYASEENRAPGVHWGDSRIEAHSDVKKQWIANVLQSKHSVLSYADVERDAAELCEPPRRAGPDVHSDDDFDGRVEETVGNEIRQVLYDLLVGVEMLLVVAAILAVCALLLRCLYKFCGGERREHWFSSASTNSGKKKYEYVVIQDDH